MDRIDNLIQSLHDGDEDFDLTDDRSIDKYLGVNIKQVGKKSIKITQPFLIERITQILGIDNGHTNER